MLVLVQLHFFLQQHHEAMPPSEHANHLQLFQQLAEGSEQTLQQIALLYEQQLLLCITQIVQNEALSKEVFSDTIHALWINRKEIAQHANPVGWMILTARNKAINMIRNEKRKATDPLHLFPMIESAERIEAEMEAKELQRLIDIAIEKLPPREKLVYTLRIKNGLSRREIAEQIHTSEHTVKNQLLNAMKNIRKQLSKMMRSVFA